ncbi:MAG: hypothetical protein WB715_05110 [Roseiarcus sp.]|uniref:hypothetical protein n=1 Tax=Roseiarcus sp. TaxID=1969460 RepID=UPI003C4F9508
MAISWASRSKNQRLAIALCSLKIGATLDAPGKRFPSEGKEKQRKGEGKSKEKEAKSKVFVSANPDFSTA